MARTLEELRRSYEDRKTRFAERDQRNRDLVNVLTGKWHLAYPGYFRSPTDRPMIANALSVAAADFADMLAPLPTLTIPPEAGGDAAQRRADKRSRIAQGYWTDWRWQVKQRQGALWYMAFGYAPVCIWPYSTRLSKQQPAGEFPDPCGYYPGPTGGYGEQPHDGFIASRKTAAEIAALYPDARAQLTRKTLRGTVPLNDLDELEVVRYHGPGEITLFLPEQGCILSRITLPSRLKHPTLLHAANPAIAAGDLQGHFDQLLGLLLARARLAALVIAYGERQVHSPIALGENSTYTEGADALLRIAPGDPIPQKVQIPLVQDLWRELDTMERDLRIGARRPASRDGESPVSYATGKGIDTLAQGVDSQLAAHQMSLGALHADVVAFSFAMDEALYPDLERPIGSLRETYIPAKDIAGRYAVEATYGLLMGTNPSYATVMLSQLVAGKFISRRTAQEQLRMIPELAKELDRLRQEQGEDAMVAFIQQAAAAGDPAGLQAAMALAPDSPIGAIVQQMLTAQQEAAAEASGPGALGGLGAAPAGAGAPPPSPVPAEQVEGATQAVRAGSTDVRALGTLLGPLAQQLGAGL